MSEDKKPEFAFGKKLGISDCLYGDIPQLLKAMGKLLYCMKETNKKHGCDSEFFRLDFRQPYFDEQMEFPIGALLLDMKWGSKKEFNEKDINEI